MKLFSTVAVLLLLCGLSFGQNEYQTYLQAYAEEVAGKRFGYHSPFPDVNTSLLLRGQEDYAPIEWNTEMVPSDFIDKYIRFIWLYGMDVTSDPVQFQLSVNGRHWFSFESSKTSDLGMTTIVGKEGAELSFNVTMLDKYKDQMGFAVLKLPVTAIHPGEAASIKISTVTTGNNSWFMTYKTRVEEKMEVYQNNVVERIGGELYHSASVDFIHIGQQAEVSVIIGESKKEAVLQAGFNRLNITLPIVEDTTLYSARIHIEGRQPLYRTVRIAPVREWEVFLVQHTHTDIGYTRPQTEILPEHLRYIDQALDFCDQTDDYPDDAKFRWTCETSWSLREYLTSRPQSQVDRLLRRIKEGRIEATGMFLNFSEIADESALATQTKTLRMLKNRGIDVTTAMQNDVNGIGWCMVDYYHNTDVKYLSMGIHAHRARKPFKKPTGFWWESPAGNRLLAYRGEHYQHGNTLSLTTGQLDVFRTNLTAYLAGLEENGYPYSKISLQFSGYVTDNSPPDTRACDIIREWNEKYEWPKLRSALARDFLIYLDEQHGDEIDVKKVAWPDWWTDGVGSAANETKVARNTQVDIAANTALLSMARILGERLPEGVLSDISEVYDHLLFYDEHTHGASESISDPLAQNTINQWGMKSAYVWEAAQKSHALQEKALAFIEPALPRSNNPTIAVFNTLNWKRSGLVSLFIQYEVIPEGVDFTITDESGTDIPHQIYQRRMEGAYYGLWVQDVPPVGYKTLRVNVGERRDPLSTPTLQSFENEFYALSFDDDEGIVSSIYDKDLQIELIDPEAGHTLGQFVYEQLANRHELERLTNTNRDTVYRELDMSRQILKDVRIVKRENGSIYNSIFLNGNMPVCADERGIDIEIRLYHYQKKIEFHYRLFKLAVQSPEAVYVSFPFQLENGKLAFEAQGGVVYPGINQLEGSSSDWNTIQNFAAVRGDRSQIVFVSDEIPLVQFGDINTGRFYYRLKPKTNHIYSWVLNNYWVTNFKASQQGELRWTYHITSSDDASDLYATRFGWGERVPLLSRVMLPREGADETSLLSRSLLNLNAPNLLLVNAAPSLDGKGIVLHLRELEGGHAILDIPRLLEETGATTIQEVNVLEEELSTLISPILIEHYETRFFKLNFQ